MKLLRSRMFSIILFVALVFSVVAKSIIPVEMKNYEYDNEDTLIEELGKEDTVTLINAFIKIEKEEKAENNEALIPYSQILCEKRKEFTEDEIIRLITENPELSNFGTVMVEIYNQNGYDPERILSYAKDDRIHEDTRYFIVARTDMTKEQNEEIVVSGDEVLVVSAMKRLMAEDENVGANYAYQLLMTSEKPQEIMASTVGISSYFKQHKSETKVCEEVVNKIWELYHRYDDEQLCSNLIYGLCRMQDFDVFKQIINATDVDDDLKVRAIDYNRESIMKRITDDIDDDDLKCIVKAMNILQLKTVGEAIKEKINQAPYSTYVTNEFVELMIEEGV